jgi:hypothetical protein
LAVYFHVDAIDPMAARLTPGVDFAIERAELHRLAEIVKPLSLEHSRAQGLSVLLGNVQDSVGTVSRLVFVREKVRPDYLEAVPDFSPPTVTPQRFLLAPVIDLVRMQLTSYRLIDKVYLIDMDSVGLITPEIENTLPEVLRLRLERVREEERQSAGAE